jgi:hypothetical protein
MQNRIPDTFGSRLCLPATIFGAPESAISHDRVSRTAPRYPGWIQSYRASARPRRPPFRRSEPGGQR